jgi:putative ABC transport system permease protein
MRHWSQLATRNWQAKKVRTFGAVLAVALGTAAVVWVLCCHESVRQSVVEWSGGYVGNAHVTVSSRLGKYDQIPQRLARRLADLENVQLVAPLLLQRRACRLISAEALAAVPQSELEWNYDDPEVDLQGVDPEAELAMRSYPLSAGRMLAADDGFVCALEASFARDGGVGVGDYLLVWDPSAAAPYELEIIGLFERRLIARFQKPLALVPLETLQRITLKSALVTSIDVMLKDADRAAVRRLGRQARRLVEGVAPNAAVRSAEARMKQVELGQANQGFVLALLGCVALLTALFIILSTLSMGMIERVRQLGLLRCVGVTRAQLVVLVLLEVVPLGVAGVLAGIPIGLALTALTVRIVPDYVGSFVVSWPGIGLASGAGIATTLLAALLPALGAVRVSALEATRPRAARPRALLLVVAVALAALTLFWQRFGLFERIVRDVNFVTIAAVAVGLLYVGYALVAPPVVRLIGSQAVVMAAKLLGVRTRLLQDQVGHAVWRSAGICCGLMVGMSLIVGLVVVNESVTRGWQFPSQFPAAYMWTFEQLPPDASERVAQVPGVGTFSVSNSINVIVEERRSLAQRLMSVTWFLGVEPDSFLDLVRLEFLDGEGDEKAARALLKQGGHVLIADDFSRSRNKHLGDTVRVWDERALRWRHFTVAGVVRSPALDIAAGYFQLLSEYQTAASGSVLGSNEDLKRVFGIDGANLVLLNFDLPDEPMPPNWPPPRDAPEARAMADQYYDTHTPLARRWQRWREEQVLRELRRRLGATQLYAGTVAELKDEIDDELTNVTRLLTAIPSVALLVAAIGVANLMTANVTARAKQLAILRAIGATRGLVLRMVIGEAVVLGLLGSALGLALGVHLASNVTTLVDRMWGFRVALELPWGYIIATIGLTVGLCVLAGVLPARHASRTNIVDALHVT